MRLGKEGIRPRAGRGQLQPAAIRLSIAWTLAPPRVRWGSGDKPGEGNFLNTTLAVLNSLGSCKLDFISLRMRRKNQV